MKTFGEYLRRNREERELPLRKVAAALDIDTSILSKIERNERRASVDMLPIISETLGLTEKEVQIEFIKSLVETELGGLSFLKEGLERAIRDLN